MRSPSLLLTILPLLPFTLADGAAASPLSLVKIFYSTYWVYSTPAHLAVSSGSINFTITNSAVDYDNPCYGVNRNSWAVFDPNTVYQCEVPEAGGKGAGRKKVKRTVKDAGKRDKLGEDDPYCWTNSASFTLDTTTPDVKNLSVAMSWTCEKYANFTTLLPHHTYPTHPWLCP